MQRVGDQGLPPEGRESARALRVVRSTIPGAASKAALMTARRCGEKRFASVSREPSRCPTGLSRFSDVLIAAIPFGTVFQAR